MILNQVKGLYVFHDSEEVGGHGSAWLAKNHGGLLDGIDFCIAFDRKGFDSVITHQAMGRTASDSFASSIAPLLPSVYRSDTGGTFTDSANYTDIIGECTNLSVGYLNQHTKQETQSISHALALRESMLRFDESKLIQLRKAGEVDPDEYMSGYNFWNFDNNKSKKTIGGFYALAQYVEKNPEDVAAFLDDMGISVDDLIDFNDSQFYGARRYG